MLLALCHVPEGLSLRQGVSLPRPLLGKEPALLGEQPALLHLLPPTTEGLGQAVQARGQEVIPGNTAREDLRSRLPKN